MSMLELLREDCGVTSVKDGCAPEGSCGACTVLLNGRACVSCAQPAARVAGRAVVTQEGLSPQARDLWTRCFVASGASQCGFCSPGIVMKAEVLLARTPSPAPEGIARAREANGGPSCELKEFRSTDDVCNRVPVCRPEGQDLY